MRIFLSDLYQSHGMIIVLHAPQFQRWLHLVWSWDKRVSDWFQWVVWRTNMSTDNAYKLNQLGINVTYFWKPTSTSFSLQLLSKRISTISFVMSSSRISMLPNTYLFEVYVASWLYSFFTFSSRSQFKLFNSFLKCYHNCQFFGKASGLFTTQ